MHVELLTTWLLVEKRDEKVDMTEDSEKRGDDFMGYYSDTLCDTYSPTGVVTAVLGSISRELRAFIIHRITTSHCFRTRFGGT